MFENEVFFFSLIQSSHGKHFYNFDTLLSSQLSVAFLASKNLWLPGWLNAINDTSSSLFLPVGPGDFLVHCDHWY